MSQDIDLIAATIWGPDTGATMAATRQAREHHRQTMDQLRQMQARAYQSGGGETSSLSHELGRQASAIGDVERRLEETQEMMEFGFNQLLWATESQTAVLRQIANALDNPRRVKADELFREGVIAFESGLKTGKQKWFEDAKREFETSLELRPYNFEAHWHLGRINFEVNGDPESAIQNFQEAARYSEVEDPRLSAVSNVWISRILWAKQEYQNAANAAMEAIRLDGNLAVAHLQLAVATARINTAKGVLTSPLTTTQTPFSKSTVRTLSGNAKVVFDAVKAAIKLDPTLYYAAIGDAAIVSIPAIRNWLTSLLRDAQKEALERAETIETMVKRVNAVVAHAGVIEPREALTKASSAYMKLRTGSTEDTYAQLLGKLEQTKDIQRILHKDIGKEFEGMRIESSKVDSNIREAYLVDIIAIIKAWFIGVGVSLAVSMIAWLPFMIFDSQSAGEKAKTLGLICAVVWIIYALGRLYVKDSAVRIAKHNKKVRQAMYFWGEDPRIGKFEPKTINDVVDVVTGANTSKSAKFIGIMLLSSPFALVIGALLFLGLNRLTDLSVGISVGIAAAISTIGQISRALTVIVKLNTQLNDDEVEKLEKMIGNKLEGKRARRRNKKRR